MKRIAVLTSGADAPGMNAAIRMIEMLKKECEAKRVTSRRIGLGISAGG